MRLSGSPKSASIVFPVLLIQLDRTLVTDVLT